MINAGSVALLGCSFQRASLHSIASMIACPLIAALGVLGALSADEREPFTVVIAPPLGHRAAAERVPAIVSAADVAFRARTMLAIDGGARFPAEVIDRCRAAGGFLCWALALRDLYGAGRSPPRLLLLLSLAVDERGRDRLSAVLLDAERALAVADAAPRTAKDWREAAEDTIYVEAVLAESAFREAADADELRVYFGKLVDQDLRPALEKTKRWGVPGSIRVIAEQESTAAGAREIATGGTLSIDARAIGAVEGSATVIADVKPGERVVGLTKADCAESTAKVQVKAKSEAEARLLITCPPAGLTAAPVTEGDDAGLWSSPWLYAGAAVAALVAGGIAVAVTLPEERTVYLLHF